MDDMDAEAEELGGKRKFFSGEYGKFGWAKLMQPGIGGHELLSLYADGISKMPENPGIPALFRDIFKNAYLPYRDPETLKSFLKVINEFSYDHSERLGDAFEYLLSVLGSQGDAGQFRTPRHIIDFIVEILAPRKEEVLLDPSCGTAGFLISAYKHILRSNTDAKGHSTLTPQQCGEMAKNFKGYDISPDMVRLSLVNLYLHGFTDPHIFEYDSLTDTARWNEYADVILANPPFMSPKGGIRPHNRFSIQAKRSEVLFVDYIAEHLTPNGRAGIIVPEGIIFQSQNAYKDLRKMLVENSLVAVISLPAGCFNPYSGVKTSILLLDKSLARQSDTIAFFKVEADGYDLGAQRRAIQKNDLPKVQEELESYLATLRERKDPSELALTTALIVPKEKIAASGDYNLSGERYREATVSNHSFPMVRPGDVCEINPKKNEVADLAPGTLVSFVPMADLGEHQMLFTPKDEKPLSEVGASYTYFRDNDVLLAKVTPCFENGKAGIARGLSNGIGFGSSEFYVLRPSEQILPEYAYFCVTNTLFREGAVSQMTGTGGLQRVPRGYVEDFQIPLPPLEIQKEIVAEIEGYQKVINGARAVLDNYRPHIPINPDWPMVEFATVARAKNGFAFKSEEYVSEGLRVMRIKNVQKGEVIDDDPKFMAASRVDEFASFRLKAGDILMSLTGNVGRVGRLQPEHEPALLNQRVAHIELKPEAGILPEFLFAILNSDKFEDDAIKAATGVAQANLSSNWVNEYPIPLPPLAEQQAIVAEIEAEQALVNANRELITRFEAKIQTTLSRIWGDESSVS
jgi:type I restriction enzyme M protein